MVLEIVRGRAESELGPDVALELTVWSRRLECQRFGRWVAETAPGSGEAEQAVSGSVGTLVVAVGSLAKDWPVRFCLGCSVE